MCLPLAAHLIGPTATTYNRFMASSTAEKNVSTEVRLSPDVVEFSQKNELLSYLTEATDLIQRCFSPVAPVAVVLDDDFETGEQRLVFEVPVELTASEASERYDGYVQQWLSMAPADVRLKMALSLDFRDGNGPS